MTGGEPHDDTNFRSSGGVCLPIFWVSLDVFFVWYNFCRVHQTLRMTPAMEAGWTDHIWTVRELLTAAETQKKAA